MFKKDSQNKLTRIAKINSYIQTSLGNILTEFLEEQDALVTISKVETSADFKWAKVWISIFDKNGQNKFSNPSEQKQKNPPLSDERVLNIINKNIYYIQGELNKKFTTKIIPRIQFFLDTSPRYAAHIEELFNKIHKEK